MIKGMIDQKDIIFPSSSWGSCLPALGSECFPHSAGADEAWAAGFSVAAFAGKTAKGAVKAKRQMKIIKKWKYRGAIYPSGKWVKQLIQAFLMVT
jgi:hypothetical protein